MPKQLLFAPAASGKTDATIQLARQTAVSGHEVRICVPTALQARAWQSRLAVAGGALGIHVLTFDRLVAACLNEAGEAYTQLSEPVQYRLLRTVIDAVSLTHYAPIKTKPGFIQVAGQLITELKSARIDPKAFARAVNGLGGEPRLRELATIYTAYQAQLQTQNWADRVGLHWLAVEALADRAPDACSQWPLLIIDGFDDFTPIQLALLTLLADRVGQFTVTLSEAAEVSFPRYQQTRQAIETALGIRGIPLPPSEVAATSQPTLRHLADHLFARSDKASIPDDGSLTLREAPDRAAEARTALRWLKQQIVWGGAAPNQVALLARDIAPYRPFITQIAAEFGLPIRLIDGQPLAHSPVISALLSLLRLHLPTSTGNQPDLSRRPLIAAWRSPYFRWENGDEAIAASSADALDMLARQQRVVGGLDQWQDAFRLAARTQGNHDEEETGRGNRLTQTAVSRLQTQFDQFLTLTQPPPAATMRGFVHWLETLIGPDPEAAGDSSIPAGSLQIVTCARANPTTAAADVAALRTLKDILRGLVWADDAVGQSLAINFATFFTELSGAITAATLYLPARPGQPEIVVSNAIQVRGLSFAAVAVMGLSEGSFPATVSEDPFLRDADRDALRQRFGFPLKRSTQSAEREFFYEAITRAREHLLLTRPVLADNGADWVASPFWEAVSQLVTIKPETIPSQAVIPLMETASPAEWWESVAARGQADTQTGDPAIWQHIQDAARLWQVRQKGETAVTNGNLTALTPNLTARFGRDHVWSVSRLESYQTCGFFFFTKSVLNLEPRPEPAEGLDVAQLGTLYHNIFEKVMKAGLPDPPTETAVSAHVAAIATPILDVAPAKQGFRETGWWAQTRQEILDNVIRSVMALTDGTYTFLQAEAFFGFHGKEPLVIEKGDDRLRLHGYIDRIDKRTDGRIRLIDYKLGGKDAYKAKVFAEGKKLQLPLYARAAQETLKLGQVANGFYWHFQKAEPSPFQLEKAEGGAAGAMETAVTHAWDAVGRIRSGQFKPQPPKDGCPAYCPAAAFCWQYASQRY